jgi:hypothetical protein
MWVARDDGGKRMNSLRSLRQYLLLLVCGFFLIGLCRLQWQGSAAGSGDLARGDCDDGQPALSWQDPDGSEQLAYPRGPAGSQTFMVFIAPDGRLQRIERVLDMEHFARIEPGKSDRSRCCV